MMKKLADGFYPSILPSKKARERNPPAGSSGIKIWLCLPS
jgi:hypothetical protein